MALQYASESAILTAKENRMLISLLVLQIVTLFALLFAFLRKPPAGQQDPRAAQLPDQIARLEEQLRTSFAESRSELRSELALNRQQADTAAAALRSEITQSISTLGQTLKTDLNSFREDNTASAERLRNDVEQRMRSISQGFAELKEEISLKHTALQEALNTKLIELMGSNTSHQDKLRATVEASLTKLNTDNSTELEKMRQTVDEKLQTTLHTRLTESFGTVSEQLMKVHTGLGEMTLLTSGVNDLNRIFSNVKSRGGIAEVQLGRLLEQILAPTQFVRNAQIKPGTQEVVEYAVRFPGATGETLLPIDAKFPREAWERLETALETGEEVVAAGKAFEAAIRIEGKRISGKYIHEPITTPHAIMFLPTESLYAEVVRRDGLQDDLQKNCRVTIAGPSTLSAILISFQMGFHMLNVQKKGNEVWKVLASTRTEFDKFGDLMTSMEKQVGTVQNTIQKLGVRTRAINRTLREVSEVDSGSAPNLIAFEDLAELPGVAPRLAASEDD